LVTALNVIEQQQHIFYDADVLMHLASLYMYSKILSINWEHLQLRVYEVKYSKD